MTSRPRADHKKQKSNRSRTLKMIPAKVMHFLMPLYKSLRPATCYVVLLWPATI